MNTFVFDLDGTLLPMDLRKFIDLYNNELTIAFKDLENPKDIVEKLWASTKHTIVSDEKIKNIDKFFNDFSNRVDGDVEKYKDIFDRLYDEGFQNVKASTYVSPELVESIEVLKSKGYKLVIATNPMFPLKANHHRVRWAGLNVEDFTYISSLEDNTVCKPKLSFYNEVIAKAEIEADKAIMVGNDVQEDMVAKNVGMKTYLITDCLINRGGDIDADYTGTYKDFLEYTKDLKTIAN